MLARRFAPQPFEHREPVLIASEKTQLHRLLDGQVCRFRVDGFSHSVPNRIELQSSTGEGTADVNRGSALVVKLDFSPAPASDAAALAPTAH
jgi:hypothetical protein